MSKKKIVFIGYVFMILGYFVFSARSGGVAEQLNSDATGSPLAAGLTCATCHSGGSFNATASMQILDGNTPVDSYVPGQTYTMTLQVSGTAPHYGGQAVALKSDNTNAGTMGVPSTDDTQVHFIGNVSYLEQSARSSSGIFTTTWTAPVTGSGDVNIYYIGNAVDGIANAGDQVTSPMVLSLTEALPVSCTIAPPTNETVEITTNTSATLTWDADAVATFHQVRYRLKGTSNWTVAGTSNTFRSIHSLTPNKYYQYKLRSQCDDGTWSDFSEIGEFYTSTCEIPTGISFVYLDENRVRIRWDENADVFKNRVGYRPYGSSVWQLKGNTPGNNFIYLTELTPDIIYEYRVRARCNNDEWSTFSDKLLFTTIAPSERLANESNISKIYPNPSNGELNVVFETIHEGDVELIITDMSGQKHSIQSKYYNKGNNREKMDVSSLSSGYYFLTIRSENSVEIMKFVKY